MAHFPQLFRFSEIFLGRPYALYSRNRCAKLIFDVRKENLCQFGIKMVTRLVGMRKFCRFFEENTENPVWFYLEVHANLIESVEYFGSIYYNTSKNAKDFDKSKLQTRTQERWGVKAIFNRSSLQMFTFPFYFNPIFRIKNY